MTFLEFIGALAAGGVVTSIAEFVLKYNLIDLIVEKVKALFGKAESDLKADESALLKKL